MALGLSAARSGARPRPARALRGNEAPRPQGGVLLLSEAGVVQSMDAGGAALLEAYPDTLDAALLESLVSAPSAIVPLPDQSALRVTLTRALQAPGGPASYFAILEPLAPRRRDPFDRIAVGADLTAREREVAKLAVLGLGNKGIGYELGISPATVGVHLTSTYKKVGVAGRVELTRVMSQV